MATAAPAAAPPRSPMARSAICADDLVFDVTTIEAPAGEEFNITFTNAEAVPHNVAVYTEEGGEEIFIGEVITGPDATTTSSRSRRSTRAPTTSAATSIRR